MRPVTDNIVMFNVLGIEFDLRDLEKIKNASPLNAISIKVITRALSRNEGNGSRKRSTLIAWEPPVVWAT